MADRTDKMLEELLTYPSTDNSEDLFVVDVMRKVQKDRLRRRLILWAFGGIGALFGMAGAVMLSGAIGQLFTGVLSSTLLMQLPLFAVGAAAFYSWIMNDDWSPGS